MTYSKRADGRKFDETRKMMKMMQKGKNMSRMMGGMPGMRR